MTDPGPSKKFQRTTHREGDMNRFYDNRMVVPEKLSQITGLRKFNNWVKAVLIKENTVRGAVVMDLCCGKGGDLAKYKKQNISFYVGTDIVENSVREAQERYRAMAPRFESVFVVGDVADPEYSVSEKIPYDLEYDLVSCQFSLNYLWESELQFRRFLKNVTEKLKPGGKFIGSVPDANVLVKKLRTLAQDRLYGNQYYSVRFDSENFPVASGAFGLKYGFFLKESIGNSLRKGDTLDIEYVPEYLVVMKTFEAIALEYDLHLVYRQNFHEFYQTKRESAEFAELLSIYLSNVKIDQGQWDACYLYLAFVFQKKGTFVTPSAVYTTSPVSSIIKLRDEEFV